MDGAAGLEAIGMGGDSTHGMHGDGAAHHLLMIPAQMIRPRNVECDLLLEGGAGEFGGDAADRVRGNAAALRHILRRPFGLEEALCNERKGGNNPAAVSELVAAHELRRRIRREGGHGRIGVAVPDKGRALLVAGEQPVIRTTRVLDDKPGRVRIAQDVFAIDLLAVEQLMDKGADEEAVCARPDADPLIRDRRVAGTDGIDRDDLGATLLQEAQRLLDRVRGMVLGHAEEHEVLRVLPVRLAEFPEGAAKSVQARRRHVDGAEAAVGGIVGRAELRGPPAGEALALISAGKKGELLGVLRAHIREPSRSGRKRFFPLDLTEFARAALADANQRLRKPGR